MREVVRAVVAPPRTALDDAITPAARLHALELLSDVSARVASTLDLQQTLEVVASAVVDSLGFGVAVLNLVTARGVEVVVVAGPAEVREALLGTTTPLADWRGLLDQSSPLGGLRFVDGRAGSGTADLLTWVPNIPVSDDAAAWHPLDALFAPLHGSDGSLIGVLSVDLPVDGRRPTPAFVELLERYARQAALAVDRARVHGELTANEELFRRVFEDAPVGMALVDGVDGRLLRVNPAYCALTGRAAEQLLAGTLWDVLDESDRAEVGAAFELLVTGRRRTVTGYVRGSGDAVGRAHASRIDSDAGVRVLVQVEDVTDQRRAEHELRERATTDPLTGLLNRASMYEQLERALADAAISGSSVALLFCDLDRFKLVNDSQGHATGDQLIRSVAQSLRRVLRGGDLAARFGGDEFVVLLRNVDGPAAAITVAERLVAAVRQVVQVGAFSITPSASVGIALSSPTSTPDLLLSEADTALYRAKAAGRGRWELFEDSMRGDAEQQLGLREELVSALARDELRLHYQPIVELATGVTVGYESLLRWQHPQRGLLLPADFLDELLGSDLAGQASDWVLERAIADAASWPLNTAGDPYRVTVNVSPRELGRGDFAERVLAAVARHRLAPGRLVVELTEDALVRGTAELQQVHVLRKGGVGVALDDFGSGYAGLLALRHVPADVVKLDRDFGINLEEPATQAIVAAVVSLARALDVVLVAEGVETEETAVRLRELGVMYAQGWHFGRPEPIESGGAALTVPARLLTEGFDGELRRLHAALELADGWEQVGEVAVQSAQRIAGIAGGSLVELVGDELHTRYTYGYPAEVVDRFRVFATTAPLPLAEVVRTGAPVYLDPQRITSTLHAALPSGTGRHVVLAALPLQGRGALVGGFGVSWQQAVELAPVTRQYLDEVADAVARRLVQLGQMA
jgi:diguanylate cyclase (GGDEF)-like protein/PAS domain S-box-containing protein